VGFDFKDGELRRQEVGDGPVSSVTVSPSVFGKAEVDHEWKLGREALQFKQHGIFVRISTNFPAFATLWLLVVLLAPELLSLPMVCLGTLYFQS
jgi:hypothetical protein